MQEKLDCTKEGIINRKRIKNCWSDLGDVLQHRHAGDLLLDGAVRVDLVPKLGSVGCMVHLTKHQKQSNFNLLLKTGFYYKTNRLSLTQTEFKKKKLQILHFLKLLDQS